MRFSFFTDKILNVLDEGLLTGMILIDFQKAFDIIDHEILLQKVKAISFLKETLQWFRSYHSEQIFFVNIEVSSQIVDKSLVRYHKGLS